MTSIDESRLGYVDTIKGVVIGGVIVAHAGMTYGLVGAWPYRELPMLQLPVPVAAAFGAAVTVAMGLLFLIAGIFTPGALERKGVRRFLVDRLLRLGTPILAYLIVVMPLLNFVGRLASSHSPSAAAQYTVERFRQLDLGPTWFLLALLLFTSLYVGFRLAARRPLSRWSFRGHGMLASAILAGVAMAAVRIIQPATDLAPINVTVWPQDLALFAFGAAAGTEWMQRIPAAVARQAAVLAIAGAAILAPLVVLPASDVGDVAGGWHWQSLVFSTGESLLTIAVVVWILRWCQGMVGSPLRRYARGSFTAYLIQAPIVLMLGIGLSPLAVLPEVKFVILAGVSVVACFGLATLYRESRRGKPRARALGPVSKGVA